MHRSHAEQGQMCWRMLTLMSMTAIAIAICLIVALA